MRLTAFVPVLCHVKLLLSPILLLYTQLGDALNDVQFDHDIYLTHASLTFLLFSLKAPSYTRSYL